MSALSEALAAAQAELPTAIPRDSQGNGYRYTSLDKLIEATRPILNAHGLFITQAPTMIERGDSFVPGLTTEIWHKDDDPAEHSMTFSTPLYLGDKNMQGLGAAITYARRYAWAAALGIASEEDTDATVLDHDGNEIPF